MKKLLGILVLGLVFSLNIFDANATSFKKGQTYEGEVFFERVKYQLPPGKWEVIDKWGWSWNMIKSKGVDLIQLEGKTLKASVSLYVFDSGGKYVGYTNQWLYEWVFMDKYDGCYTRSEYYVVKAYKHGAAFNCFVVRHHDIKKELYQPDDPKDKVWSAMWRKYIKDNNIKLPPISISRWHMFYAPTVGYQAISVWYEIFPEFYDGPKNKFVTEETSEYHRSNIDRYPDHKKFMEDWVKKSAIFHKQFEKDVKAKPKHKLDLSEYVQGEIIEETKTTSSSSGLTEELIELNKLYEEGVLTKEEFEKAKKKVLSQ